MKKFAFILLVTGISSVITYAQDTQNLIGSWTVDFNQTLLGMDNTQKALYDSMSVKARQKFQESFQGRTFTFAANHALTVHFVANGTSRDVPGQWTYQPATNLLQMTVATQTSDYEVVWLSPTQVKLLYRNVAAHALLKSLYLTRS